MRVVAGTYRGRKLKSLRGLALRPTSDRLRETLFNILGPAVENSVFIDLYAGTGAVGIEALSRGARFVAFVEKRPPAVAVIRRNLESLGIPVPANRASRDQEATGAEVLATEALRGLKLLAGRGLRADLVFVDPPYADAGAYATTLNFLDRAALLAPGARIILEHARRRVLPERLSRLRRARIVMQGDAAVSFYELG